MSDLKERSSLFKFFYIMLSIITFPFFVIIYIIKHPKISITVLLILGGIIAYFPLKNGVKYNNIIEWYKNKLNEAKMEVVANVIDEDNILLSEKKANEIKELKKDLESLKKEENMVKGEYFNEKVKRVDEFEDVASKVRKKGGFKKKGETKRIQNAEALVEEGQKIDGLKGFMLKKEQLDKEKLINDGDVMLFEDDNEKLGKVKEEINPIEPSIDLEDMLNEEPLEIKEEPLVIEEKKVEKHNVFDENMIDLEHDIEYHKKEVIEEKVEEIEAEAEDLELF